MTEAEIRDGVLQALHRIAPDIDPNAIAPDADLREEAGLDSFDHLQFIMELSEHFGIELVEADYPHLGTVNAIVAFLVSHQASKTSA